VEHIGSEYLVLLNELQSETVSRRANVDHAFPQLAAEDGAFQGRRPSCRQQH
jgi:hypothetical protein